MWNRVTTRKLVSCYGPAVEQVIASARGGVTAQREPPSSRVTCNTLVASAQAGEGRTTTALGLAITAAVAKPRKRILLADLDLRKSALSRMLGLAGTTGIREVIGAADGGNLFRDTRLENLKVLASGTGAVDLPEALLEDNLIRLLDTAGHQFDLAFYDSPPLNDFVDAKVLSDVMNGVILVARSGRSRSEDLVAARRLIKGDVVGVILNGHHDYVPSLLRRCL